jgi:hypothetical protein
VVEPAAHLYVGDKGICLRRDRAPWASHCTQRHRQRSDAHLLDCSLTLI